MNITEIGRRYASALVALSKQKGVHQQALSDLKAIQAIIHSDASFVEYFQSPVVSPDQKRELIKKAFGGQGLLEETMNLMILLADRQRLSQLDSVVGAVQERIDQEEGLTRGVVRSAKPLSNEALADLEKKISGTLKKKVILTYQDDPKLLGGMIAEVGGWTFDDSLETHLRNMNEELNRSAQ